MKALNLIRGIVRKAIDAFRSAIRPLVSGMAAAALGFVLATEAAPKFAAAVLAGTIMSATTYSEAKGGKLAGRLRGILRNLPERQSPQEPYQPQMGETRKVDSLSKYRLQQGHRYRPRTGGEQNEDFIRKLRRAGTEEVVDCIGKDPEFDVIGTSCIQIRETFGLETEKCSASGSISCKRFPYVGNVPRTYRDNEWVRDLIPRNQTPYRQTWELLPNQLPPPSPEFPAEVKP